MSEVPEVRLPVELSRIQPAKLSPQQTQPGAESFKQVFDKAIAEVQKLQDVADQAVKQLASGEVADVNQALIAVEKADVAFNTMMQVRNKIVATYEEVLRMQV